MAFDCAIPFGAISALGWQKSCRHPLRTTNPIENLNGSIVTYTRNVKRWRDGQMVQRWVASAPALRERVGPVDIDERKVA